NKHGSDLVQGSSQKSGGYFQVPDLVFDLPLTANEKLVLIYFMRRADRAGRSFPSVERICRDCGIKSQSTVRKVLKGLEREGLVRIERKPSKSNSFYVAGWLYETIERAKVKHAAKRKNAAVTSYDDADSDTWMDTPQDLSPCPSEFVPSTPQILTPKEYTVEPGAENEYTVKKEVRKNIKRTHEEAHASSSLSPPLDDYDDNGVTLLDVAEHLHSLTPRERKEFDREALKLGKPGEPDPQESLWQKRLLRVRYLRQMRDG
ncbi:MAG: helix-turn-helix domain-containing protein, partial [Candidatus Dadabacteria bacterium]|nr:helix-turn-helix domain-containing protein [Candidatus Dadabacteria bacterium]